MNTLAMKCGEHGLRGMLRLVLSGTLAVLMLCAECRPAHASETVELTSLRDVHVLTNEQAARALPVAFEATVTYYRKGNVDLFVQDGDFAIYVETSVNEVLETGDRVVVRGVTRASFRPEVKSSQIVFLRHGTPPAAVGATFRQLVRAELDCRRVTVRAVVRGANTVMDVGSKSTYLQLLMDGGDVDAEVFGSQAASLAEWLDAEVEVTGAVAGKFDSKMQMTGILLEVPSLKDVRIVKRAERAPGALPVTPMDEILKSMDVQDRTQRVRVEGSVTYYQPGSAIVLQDGSKSLWVRTEYEEPLRVGEWVSASGFPQVDNGFLILSRGEIESTGQLRPIAPHTGDAAELLRGEHASDLVSVQGRLLMAIREAAQDEYVLVSGAHLFSAIYRHPGHGLEASLPPLKQVPVGATVKVTGICALDRGDLYQGPAPFEVLLRTPDDVLEVAGPSMLNVGNLLKVVALLLLILFGLGAREWVIERRERTRATQLVRVEQMRSEILGRINRAHPLPEVLAQITQLVSLALPGTDCWCMMENREQIGAPAGDQVGKRLVENVIAARSSPPYGVLWAAFGRGRQRSPKERSVLSTAAELATIAIETSRTHSDLLMRSEFDPLTGVHNRFALEKRLESIGDSRTKKEGVQALIFLDLDDFKQVNDTFGHHVGDLYLKEAALRMKHQVRPADMLARLGGDEFAVVVTGAHRRSDVEDIANRLKGCFHRRFELDGLELSGSASFGIAYYPEDGTTKQALLKAADSAMYERKRAKRVSPAEIC
jgi:diguanylate cyclase (GGDEF)-like protein